MKYLFIFPHPDDESFGPASSISKLKRQGNSVSLLTLTKGGATKVRHDLNLSITEMGEVRYKEMLNVKDALELDQMKVLDLPDSGLKHLDPRIIENAVSAEIQVSIPDIIITYPVHGISGFHDHLVIHAVVKRVYMELKDELRLKRLAFFTLSEDQAKSNEGMHNLHFSTGEEIDCVLDLMEEDVKRMDKALDCYETYREVIEKTIKRSPRQYKAHYEFFLETFDPSVDSLDYGLT